MEPTEEQKKVINTHSGVIIVSANPGSGKTSSMVKRCKALPPHETKLVLAFNKKAADDFASRMGAVSCAEVKTFHSFCFREVMQEPRKYGYRSKPTLSMDESFFGQLQQANETKFKSWDDSGWDEDFAKILEHSYYDSDVQDVINENKKIHDDVKHMNCPLNKRDEGCDIQSHFIDAPEKATAVAIRKYRAWLFQQSKVTFDAMVRLVAEYRDEISKSADHVMIDEFQDVNCFQFDIGEALARKENVKSFAVIGDPKQCIFTWRGALHSAFKMLKNKFPHAIELPMTINFRSVDSIIDYAERVYPSNMKGVRGDLPNAVMYLSQNDDSALSVLLDGKKADLTTNLSNYAILCRYNRDCAKWQIDLAKKGVPVFLFGKGEFWNQKHIKLALNARSMKWNLSQIFDSEDFHKLASRKKYRENPEALKELEDDIKFIITMSDADLVLLQKTIQREDIGINIATMHRTKGLEWDGVILSNVTEKLKAEQCLFFVACTRPKNKLVLA